MEDKTISRNLISLSWFSVKDNTLKLSTQYATFNNLDNRSEVFVVLIESL